MGKLYFVDTKNVGETWLKLIEHKEDPSNEYLLFYTVNSPKLPYDQIEILLELARKPEFFSCQEDGASALNIQLSTYLGFRLQSELEEVCIISEDSSYDAVISFWKKLGRQIERLDMASYERDMAERERAQALLSQTAGGACEAEVDPGEKPGEEPGEIPLPEKEEAFSEPEPETEKPCPAQEGEEVILSACEPLKETDRGAAEAFCEEGETVPEETEPSEERAPEDTEISEETGEEETVPDPVLLEIPEEAYEEVFMTPSPEEENELTLSDEELLSFPFELTPAENPLGKQRRSQKKEGQKNAVSLGKKKRAQDDDEMVFGVPAGELTTIVNCLGKEDRTRLYYVITHLYGTARGVNIYRYMKRNRFHVAEVSWKCPTRVKKLCELIFRYCNSVKVTVPSDFDVIFYRALTADSDKAAVQAALTDQYGNEISMKLGKVLNAFYPIFAAMIR